MTPILAFALPVVDTGVTMVRRLISGRPIFQGDSEHIHHMLLARGWSQRHVALVLYAVCAMFGLLAAISTKTSSPLTGFGLFVIAVAVIVAVGHLRYHEMEELRAGVKRTVGDRRVRLANNIRVRRASLALSRAANLDELFEPVGQMLDFGEFAYANAQIGRPGHAEVSARALKVSEHCQPSQGLELRNSQIFWSWEREGVEADKVMGSKLFWCFRLPLSTEKAEWGWMNFYRAFDSEPLLLDTNYLTGVFRSELSEAVERILGTCEQKTTAAELSMSITAGKIIS